ncbi:hypothetical protein [Kluyvera sichuanensis]|uniref:hypothetical protein n=1 Tax=Kluyvera sichuanensis TaxID=2725494 RepID=UPI0034A1F7D7
MKPTYEQLEAQVLELSVKLANAESKCVEVVAESAGLKSVLEEIINAAEPEYHEQGMGCGVEDRGYQRDGYSACSYGWYSAIDRIYSEVIPGALPETPATDAAIANIQAQGVEMYAITLDRGADDAERGGFDDGMKFLRAEAESVRKFAAQLRQGVEHE